VRELVYLSDRKIAQFMPALRQLQRWPRISARIPGIDLSWEPSADERHRQLTQVVAQIERTAVWFADPAARPGQWLQFEAPLNCVTVFGILFLTNPPTQDDPAIGATRLLLHGSAEHSWTGLRPANVPAPQAMTEVAPRPDGSAQTLFTVDSVAVLLRLLSAQRPPADGPDPLAAPAGTNLAAASTALLAALDARTYPETATWMTGFARLTARVDADPATHILASPLYIEYAPPPDRPD
jgi:hypothetical protein